MTRGHCPLEIISDCLDFVCDISVLAKNILLLIDLNHGYFVEISKLANSATEVFKLFSFLRLLQSQKVNLG